MLVVDKFAADEKEGTEKELGFGRFCFFSGTKAALKKVVFSFGLVSMSGIGSKVSDENDHKEGRDDDQVLVEAEVRGQVALVLLAEAHPAAAAALSHTNVIHHKVVDVEVVRAASTYFGLRCKNCRFFGRVVRLPGYGEVRGHRRHWLEALGMEGLYLGSTMNL